MIDLRKLILLGALSAAGCTNSVRQEEFAAYKTQSENTLKALKEEFSAEQKKALTDANARYDALIKEIESLKARLSVSSIDNYAAGLEEQVTQHARRYAQLSRTIVNLQKNLEETTNKEIAKLRTDTKTAEDSLTSSLTELKKLFDDTKKSYEMFKNEDYKAFKEQSLEEKEARQKNIEALETGMQNLARLIQQMEKNADISKVLEAAGKKTFVFTARASYENPVTYALAMEQWRIEVEHRKIAGEPVDKSPLTRIYRFSKASGEDDVIQVNELKDDELEAKIAQLRRKDNKPYEELNLRKLIISDKYKDTASINIIPADERQEEMLTELLEYKTPKQAAYVAGMLGINAKDGKITSEKLEYIMSKVKEKYGK
jgi:hypothetical protein